MPVLLADYLFWPLLKIGIVFSGVMLIIMFLPLAERKIIGFMQVRLGPNRV